MTIDRHGWRAVADHISEFGARPRAELQGGVRFGRSSSNWDRNRIDWAAGPPIREQVREVGPRGAGRQFGQDVFQVHPRIDPMSLH